MLSKWISPRLFSFMFLVLVVYVSITWVDVSEACSISRSRHDEARYGDIMDMEQNIRNDIDYVRNDLWKMNHTLNRILKHRKQN